MTERTPEARSPEQERTQSQEGKLASIHRALQRGLIVDEEEISFLLEQLASARHTAQAWQDLTTRITETERQRDALLSQLDAQSARVRELTKYAKHREGCRKGSRADYHPQATFGADCSCGLDDILYPEIVNMSLSQAPLQLPPRAVTA